MNYNEFKEAVKKYAARQGVTEYDLYFSAGGTTSVFVFGGEIDNFSDNSSVGACFRCMTGGSMGYSHTQMLSDEEAARLVKDAKAGAGVTGADEFASIFAGSPEYEKIPGPGRGGCDVEQLKKLSFAMEKAAKDRDVRVVSVPYSVARYFERDIRLMNSKGLDLENRQVEFMLVCEVVIEAKGRKYVGESVQARLSADALDPVKVACEAVDAAVASIGGYSVKSGVYPVVFQNKMMCEILSTFSGIFSGDSAQKGLSLLKGREGDKIAADCVTLSDDPFYADSADKSPFDDEGVATKKKAVIKNGVLETLLYDLRSAAKAGKSSTGNGRKYSYAGAVNVAPFNFILEPGSLTGEQVIAKAGTGLYITELKGMHASANPSTGDFSLEAKGQLIENGKIKRPAEQFTIAGNFYELLKDITAMGSDITLENGFGAGTTLVSGLSVAGSGE